MPEKPLANTQGQIDREALRARINAALKVTEPQPVRRPLTIERQGTDIRVLCWCGKAKRLETRNINVFVRAFNDFLYEHSYCEPGGCMSDGENLSKEQQEAIAEATVHLKPLIVEEALMLQRAFPDLDVAWNFCWDISLKKEHHVD